MFTPLIKLLFLRQSLTQEILKAYPLGRESKKFPVQINAMRQEMLAANLEALSREPMAFLQIFLSLRQDNGLIEATLLLQCAYDNYSYFSIQHCYYLKTVLKNSNAAV